MSKREEFSAKVKDQAYARSGGKCEKCHLPFNGRRAEFHHILECAFGGKPTLANCLCICAPCHRDFTAKGIKVIRKSDRVRRANNGAKTTGPKIESAGFAPSTKRKTNPTPLPPRTHVCGVQIDDHEL